jgi:serine/threonine-protein kinase
MSESPPGSTPAQTRREEGSPQRRVHPVRLLIRLGWAAVITAALAGLFVASFVFAMRTVFTGREVTVPDVSGRTLQEAAAILKESDLHVEATATRYDDHVEKDRVLLQDPAAGSTLKRNRKVRVAMSLGPLTVRIPDLRGASQRGARATLERSGLAAGVISYTHERAARADLVIAQEPWPDVEETPGVHGVSAADGAVDLLVSRGPEPAVYVMPDLSERRLDEVERMARRYGLRLGGVRREPTGSSQRGLVLRQAPEAGFPVSRRDIIMLVIGE